MHVSEPSSRERPKHDIPYIPVLSWPNPVPSLDCCLSLSTRVQSSTFDPTLSDLETHCRVKRGPSFLLPSPTLHSTYILRPQFCSKRLTLSFHAPKLPCFSTTSAFAFSDPCSHIPSRTIPVPCSDVSNLSPRNHLVPPPVLIEDPFPHSSPARHVDCRPRRVQRLARQEHPSRDPPP